jgi:hypothetical protein
MKYLKKYNESIVDNEYKLLVDIKDICQELIDDSNIRLLFDTRFDRTCNYILIRKENIDEYFEWDEIKDVCLRIKQYLGNRFLRFKYREFGLIKNDTKYSIINLDEETIIKGPIFSIGIEYL